MRQGALADLRVVAEQPHRRIGDCQAGAARTVVEEFEPAVLVVRDAGIACTLI